MNKMILVSVLLASTTAFADNNFAIDQIDSAAIIQHEAGALDPQDLEASGNEATFYRSSSGEAIVGGIIGGVIGAIAADRWDRDNDYDHDHDFRPGRPGRPGGPGAGRFVACFAQNRRGEMFRATAYRARMAQRAAVEKCYQFSRFCRPVGCR